MRAPAQIIDELRDEAPPYSFICLAVGFEYHTEAITPNARDPVEMLMEMIDRGGQPMGFVAFLRTAEGHLELRFRHLQEWEGEKEWVHKYLAAYADDVARELVATGNG